MLIANLYKKGTPFLHKKGVNQTIKTTNNYFTDRIYPSKAGISTIINASFSSTCRV